MLPPVLAERGTQDPSDLQTMGGARSTRAVGVSQAALLGLEEEVKGISMSAFRWACCEPDARYLWRWRISEVVQLIRHNVEHVARLGHEIQLSSCIFTEAGDLASRAE
jgi:hypothetical protein